MGPAERRDAPSGRCPAARRDEPSSPHEGRADGTEAAVERADEAGFRPINRGYDRVFRVGSLSLGLVVPLESYPSAPVPTMARHLERVHLAETLGYPALWLRDVPFDVPSFGDAGQTFDPFVYLGFLAARTERIALSRERRLHPAYG